MDAADYCYSSISRSCRQRLHARRRRDASLIIIRAAAYRAAGGVAPPNGGDFRLAMDSLSPPLLI